MNNRGFTLIELLVVIAIIALLASILFPVFNQAREKARQTTCASNLKQIYLAISMYASDNDGYFPSGWQYYTYSGGYPYVGAWVWKTGLYPAYASSKEIFFCPGTSNGYRGREYFIKTWGYYQTGYFYWPDCDGRWAGGVQHTYYRSYMGGSAAPVGYHAPLGPAREDDDHGKPIIQDAWSGEGAANSNHAAPGGRPYGLNCLFFEGNVLHYPAEKLSLHSSSRLICRP